MRCRAEARIPHNNRDVEHRSTAPGRGENRHQGSWCPHVGGRDHAQDDERRRRPRIREATHNRGGTHPGAEGQPDPGPYRGHRNLPHRSARCQGGLACQTQPPFIPGHEGVGTAVAIGRAVRSVKEGDRVGIPWLHTACGYCSHCRTGWETLCASQLNSGYSVNGNFAEYALADPNFIGRIPDKLEWGPAAPVLCAGVTVYKGLKETEVKPAEWVVISGIGGLGPILVT